MQLTKRNLQVLRAIRHYANHYHAWPSLQDIANRLNVTKRAIQFHLVTLTANNLTSCHHFGPESGWKLTPQAYATLKAKPVTISHNLPPRYIRNVPNKLRIWTMRQDTKRRREAALYDAFPTIQ